MKKNFLVILSIIILSLTFISCSESTPLPPIQNNDSQNDNSKPTAHEPENTNDKIDDNVTIKDDVESNDISDTNLNTENNSTTDNISQKKDKSVRLYFYDVINDNIVYYDDIVEVTDKAVTTALINALKHPSNPNVTPSIPENIDVTSAKLDEENNIFTIDFPANFVSEMNLGSGPESSTLKSIVNTLGYNFGVDNVIITLGGNPYESGHIALSEGESFKVSLDTAINLD